MSYIYWGYVLALSSLAAYAGSLVVRSRRR